MRPYEEHKHLRFDYQVSYALLSSRVSCLFELGNNTRVYVCVYRSSCRRHSTVCGPSFTRRVRYAWLSFTHQMLNLRFAFVLSVYTAAVDAADAARVARRRCASPDRRPGARFDGRIVFGFCLLRLRYARRSSPNWKTCRDYMKSRRGQRNNKRLFISYVVKSIQPFRFSDSLTFCLRSEMKILKRDIEKDSSGWIKVQPEEVSQFSHSVIVVN